MGWASVNSDSEILYDTTYAYGQVYPYAIPVHTYIRMYLRYAIFRFYMWVHEKCFWNIVNFIVAHSSLILIYTPLQFLFPLISLIPCSIPVLIRMSVSVSFRLVFHHSSPSLFRFPQILFAALSSFDGRIPLRTHDRTVSSFHVHIGVFGINNFITYSW